MSKLVNVVKSAAIPVAAAFLVASPAHAQLEQIATQAQNIFTGINAASITIVALAILFAGIGMLFQWIRFQTAAWIVIGAILIGSAVEIATMLVG